MVASKICQPALRIASSRIFALARVCAMAASEVSIALCDSTLTSWPGSVPLSAVSRAWAERAVVSLGAAVPAGT